MNGNGLLSSIWRSRYRIIGREPQHNRFYLFPLLGSWEVSADVS
jgi:hypothetical protein